MPFKMPARSLLAARFVTFINLVTAVYNLSSAVLGRTGYLDYITNTLALIGGLAGFYAVHKSNLRMLYAFTFQLTVFTIVDSVKATMNVFTKTKSLKISLFNTCEVSGNGVGCAAIANRELMLMIVVQLLIVGFHVIDVVVIGHRTSVVRRSQVNPASAMKGFIQMPESSTTDGKSYWPSSQPSTFEEMRPAYKTNQNQDGQRDSVGTTILDSYGGGRRNEYFDPADLRYSHIPLRRPDRTSGK